MADSFKRHIKNRRQKGDNLFYKKEGDWFMRWDGGDFKIIENDKPNCVAGNAATIRAIRYEVESNKIKDNYNSFVGIFPLCSMTNVLNGVVAANKFYKTIDLVSLLVFFGKACFDISPQL